MPLISVIVPCYNEQESLPLFYDEIKRVSAEMSRKSGVSFEYLFVNDGSSDDTLKILREYADSDATVRYISFSRNFGKEAAMLAGMQSAKGDYVVIMDADLQHPPAFLPQMYEYVASGDYDCASTRRVSRKGEPKVKSFFSRMFYKIMRRISGIDIVDGAQDYRFMTRRMVDGILELKETNRFSKGIFAWVGFRTKYIEYENVERVAGSTKWGFWKLFKYSLDGIFAFSTAPLAFSSFLGLIFCAISAIMIIVIVIKTVIWGDPVAGFPTLICVIFLLGGLQLFSTGILGHYLSRTYMETKRRPPFLIAETEEDRQKNKRK